MRFVYSSLTRFELSLALCALLSGCTMDPSATPSASQGTVIQGRVHGGSQPISGAHVYLFAANTTGYGNASVSLLNAATTGLSDSIGAYVTSDPTGSFSITGAYACTANTQVYLYSLGGDPGAGANSAAGLLAILGNCPSSGSFLPALPLVQVNEATTVAAAYAFAGYATDAVHVSSSGTALAKIGVANAFANAANLASIISGQALATTPAGNGTVPQSEINTLANLLASCINSNGAITGPSSPSTCYTLLNNALSSGTSGNVPSDTATAAINIAHNPGVNIANLCGLQAGVAAPFLPDLACTSGPGYPNDFTIALNFTGGGLDNPIGIAVDGLGNAWATNYFGTSVSEFSNLGVALSPAGGFTNGVLTKPFGIAIDGSGDAWVADFGTSGVGGVTEISPAGTTLSPSGGYTGGVSSAFYSVAIDGSGNAWSMSATRSLLVELTSSGALAAGETTAGYSGGGMASPLAIAIDSSENVWTANENNTVSKFSSSGAAISTSAGFTGGGLNNPYAIAVDHSGNAWVANLGTPNSTTHTYSGSNIAEFSPSGAAVSSSTGYTGGGLSIPQGIAIDGLNNVWAVSIGEQIISGLPNNSNVSEFSNSGVAISPSTGYIGGGIFGADAIAIDGSGDVWIANGNSTNNGTSLVEFIGAAAPVVTPLATGVKNGTLGARP
jgi:hypothetical protein